MGIKVLSLFDGMCCGMLAFQSSGVKVDTYDAYEIDKYAIQATKHNFPDVREHGDVFKADFTQYNGVDYLIGGSPCFTKGHWVLTDRGYKDISEIQVGDKVLTHTGAYKKVIRTNQREANIYDLKVMGYPTFHTTANHPFYTIKRDGEKFSSLPEWTEVKDLTTAHFCGRHIDKNFDLEDIFNKGLNECSTVYVQNNIAWTQVKSVTPTERVETVYNIEVEGDNSYTVNNCIVHNCTYWSIAQKNNRETEASGMGWDLFSQYVRALHEANPKYFIYENNKSMSAAIRKNITDTFGFDAICINSALVSAQNRQRLYWVGKRNPDGTYSKVSVQQPEDREILLKDILDCGNDLTSNNKSWALTVSYKSAVAWNTIERCQRNMVAEPVNMSADDKAFCLTSRYYKGFGNNPGKPLEKHRDSMVAEPVNTTIDGKSHTVKAQYYKNGTANFVTNSGFDATAVAEPVVGAAQRGRYNENGEVEQTFEVREDEKSNCVTTVNKDCMVAVGVDNPKQVGSLPRPNGELSVSQAFRIYDVEGKSVTINANGGGAGGKTGLYAIDIECHGYAQPCEWDENGIPMKAISGADGKKHTVYEVKDGLITIKEKTYPIKLNDGYYIIRKLTVSECKRLQQVPEWYEFPVSDSQAYRMLGNGWSVEVIAHLINATTEGG